MARSEHARATHNHERECQFVTGGELGARVYCNAETQRGSAYCAAHHVVCWTQSYEPAAFVRPEQPRGC